MHNTNIGRNIGAIHASAQVLIDLGVLDRQTYHNALRTAGATGAVVSYQAAKKLYSLIPQLSMASASKTKGKLVDKFQKRKPRDSLSNEPFKEMEIDEFGEMTHDANMGMVDTDPGNTGIVTKATTGTQAALGTRGSEETPVTYVANPSYGLQDTHTTIIPQNHYFSVTKVSRVGQVIDIRLTSPRSPIKTSIATPVPPAAFTTGVFNARIVHGSSAWASPLGTFPDNNQATQYGPYQLMWEKLYGYYTVLGCEYEITIQNQADEPDQEIMVGWGYNVFGADTSTNYPTNAVLSDVMYFKNTQFKVCHNEHLYNKSNRSKITTIRGSYKPSQANRAVENDGDVKTWVATNAQPVLQEDLHLMFFSSPLGLNDNVNLCANVMVTLKYIVQYKQLRNYWRYPNSATANVPAQDIKAPTDIGGDT